MYDVITFGSSTTDVFVDTELPEIYKGKERLIAYKLGSKILIKKLDFLIGGCAVNTAIGFSRLGLKTACISKIGRNNSNILEALKKENIDFLGNATQGIGGYSIILDSRERNRTILNYRSLNDEISPHDIDMNSIRAKWIYIAAALKESLRTVEMIVKTAKQRDMRVALNPSDYQIKKYRKRVKKILKKTDILIFNKEEAQALVGNYDAKRLLKKSFFLGPRIVCITDGNNGSWVYDGKEIYFLKPHNIRVVERTGAGDAFSSGFIGGVAKKQSIEFALRVALANAESVIKYPGAQNRLLNWNEAVRIVRKNPAVIKRSTEKSITT